MHANCASIAGKVHEKSHRRIPYQQGVLKSSLMGLSMQTQQVCPHCKHSRQGVRNRSERKSLPAVPMIARGSCGLTGLSKHMLQACTQCEQSRQGIWNERESLPAVPMVAGGFCGLSNWAFKADAASIHCAQCILVHCSFHLGMTCAL